MISILRGSIRIALGFIVLSLTTLLVLLLALLPTRSSGIPLAARPLPVTARLLAWIFGVVFHHPPRQQFYDFDGFVFPNHLSYLDIVLLIHIMPMRFLSTIEVRAEPLVGWIAQAIGTVFVDRGDDNSRGEARRALSQLQTYPPVVIFPEGGIWPPGDEIKPLRHGAFEIAINGRRPILPCVFRYESLALIFRYKEPFRRALWDLAARSGPLQVELVPLPIITPSLDDKPEQLAEVTRQAMNEALHATS